MSLSAAGVEHVGAGVGLPAGEVQCDVEQQAQRDDHPCDEP